MKYFILFTDMNALADYLQKEKISNNHEVVVCSQLATLDNPKVEKGLIEADIRMILPDFVNNPQAKAIGHRISQIMLASSISTRPLIDFFNKHNLL